MGTSSNIDHFEFQMIDDNVHNKAGRDNELFHSLGHHNELATKQIGQATQNMLCFGKYRRSDLPDPVKEDFTPLLLD